VTYVICAGLGLVALGLRLLSVSAVTIAAVILLGLAFWGFGAALCRLAPVPEHSPASDAVVSRRPAS
jgi:hypothetical protein